MALDFTPGLASDTFVPNKWVAGTHPATGEPIYGYDYRDHPGMYDGPPIDDPLTIIATLMGNTHTLHFTGLVNGKIACASGNVYDLTEGVIAVLVEDSDEVELQIHATGYALGFTPEPVPAQGQIAAAAAAFGG